MTDDYRAFLAVLQTDLLAFLERAFRDVDQRNELIVADYVELLVAELTRVAEGKETRLIINLPPRHLKSILVSVVFPAWLLGRDPKLRIAVISHSQSLARDLALKTRRLMESKFYREVFPNTRLCADRHQATDFETIGGGGRLAASFDTSVTGRGFDYIIIDDPISAHDARSAAERERVMDAYDGMVLSRFDDQRRGVFIVVGQRLHDDDLSGYLLSKGSWKHICLPLLAEQQTTHSLGSRLWTRDPGTVLLPELWPTAIVERTRQEAGPAIFAAQYQQNPSAATGELIRPDQIGFVDQIPSSATKVTLSWDTAVKTSENASYTVCLVIASAHRNHYVIDVLRQRLDPVQMRDAAVRLIKQYNPAVSLIEDASSGPGLARMLQEAGHRVELLKTGGLNKEERLESVLFMFVDGRVFVLRNQPWVVELINEWTRFPFAKHDDQMDAMTQYLAWVASKPVHPPCHLASADSFDDMLAKKMQGRPLRKGEHPMRPRGPGRRFFP